MYNLWERLSRSMVIVVLSAPHRRRILAHELQLAARGSGAYVAVSSLVNNRLEELFFAGIVWGLLLLGALIIFPSESEGD